VIMRADGQDSGRQYTKQKHHRRGGHGRRRARWPRSRVLMSLPRSRQRALDRIGRSLVAEDPDLGARFTVFIMLTRHEPMPGTEQVPSCRQRFLRGAMLLPLLGVGLVALLAASWLTSGRPACPDGPNAAVHGVSSVSHAARCQPSPAIRLDTMPAH
jgi:hypothetical protein